jgi:hypothetical protein
LIRRVTIAALAGTVALASRDVPMTAHGGSTAPAKGDMAAPIGGSSSRGCQGDRPPVAPVLTYELRAGAFPGSSHPDVAVHVPSGFDATRRPGLVVYLHGWWGCIANALDADDGPCSEGGPIRPAADLARSVDEAHVNALLVAIELRPDMPTGEPGQLASPGGLRALLRELFTGPLAGTLGCTLDVDALDRVVLVAHSGGYQAAASALTLGDVPRVTELDLLDALYGGDASFFRWFESEITRFDPLTSDSLRLVDLYTCCGGTADRSRALARRTQQALAAAGLSRSFSESALTGGAVVFKEVTQPHGDLPRTYLRALVLAAGFARRSPSSSPSSDGHAGAHTGADESHSLRLN